MVVIPLLAIGLFFIAHIITPIFKRVFKTYDKLNRIVRENLHGVRVVKSFVREEHETEKFKSVSGEIQRDFTKAEKILAFNSPMMQAAIYICLILICWFSAKAIVGSAAGIAGSMFMQVVIDDYILCMVETGENRYRGLLLVLAAMAAVYAVGALCTWLYNRFMAIISQSIPMMISSAFSIVLSFCVMIHFNLWLTIVVLVITVITIFRCMRSRDRRLRLWGQQEPERLLSLT